MSGVCWLPGQTCQPWQHLVIKNIAACTFAPYPAVTEHWPLGKPSSKLMALQALPWHAPTGLSSTLSSNALLLLLLLLSSPDSSNWQLPPASSCATQLLQLLPLLLTSAACSSCCCCSFAAAASVSGSALSARVAAAVPACKHAARLSCRVIGEGPSWPGAAAMLGMFSCRGCSARDEYS